MQPEIYFDATQLNSLYRAIARNPAKVLTEVGSFLVRGMAAYKAIVIRNPWRVGAIGGGAPVATGNLRDTHQTQIGSFEARFFPTVKYARYLHEGTRRMRSRPWLDYARQQAEGTVKNLEVGLLDNIVRDLAK